MLSTTHGSEVARGPAPYRTVMSSRGDSARHADLARGASPAGYRDLRPSPPIGDLPDEAVESADAASIRAVVGPPLDLIACPVCHAGLLASDDGVRCDGCGRSFPDGPLDLTPIPPPDEAVRSRWPLWEQLQANFLVAAIADPESSLSVTDRVDANLFGEFCGLTGVVLDVGCGTQRVPTYADVSHCRFVGMDPLRGEPGRDFEFLQGVAEYLPFRDDSFDQVLFATSLDHTLVPQLALAEGARVVRPGGAVNIWFGEIRPPGAVQRLRTFVGHGLERFGLRSPYVEPEYLAQIEQPEGAVDKFHVAHPGPETIGEWLAAAGLQPSAPQRISYNNSCFIRGTKPLARPGPSAG